MIGNGLDLSKSDEILFYFLRTNSHQYGNIPYICPIKFLMMETKGITKGTARFDTRLSKEQKELFEYAARLGGFRTLTEFVIHSAQEKAQVIVKEHQNMLESERDRDLFFAEVLNPGEPNQELLQAAENYQKYLRSNELSD